MPGGVYEQVLGPAWSALPVSVRSTHAVGEARGVMRVRWGESVIARVAARLLGFPRPAPSVRVALRIEPLASGLRWARQMGQALVITEQWVADGLLLEAFGAIVCAFELVADPGGLRYVQTFAALRLGSARLRLPRWASPRVAARVEDAGDAARTEVEISAPLLGPILRYDGVMQPVRAEPVP